jgi:hypothetical protein
MPTTENNTDSSEAAIFGRVLRNGRQELTPQLARYLLGLAFSEEDKARMHALAVKNQDGALSPGEREELANYVKVGHLVAILQSKARKALRKKPASR